MRSEKLTMVQRETLAAIVAHRAEHGYSPTVRELCELLGVRSLNAVVCRLAILERKGALRRTPMVARSLVPTEGWTLNECQATVES